MDKSDNKAKMYTGVFVGLGFLIIVISGVAGTVINFAIKGHAWAIILLTVVGVLVIGFFFNAFLVAFMFANQKQDERLMMAQQRVFADNAIENMKILNQTQNGMLLMQRQQTEQARGEKVRSGIPVIQNNDEVYLMPPSDIYAKLEQQ